VNVCCHHLPGVQPTGIFPHRRKHGRPAITVPVLLKALDDPNRFIREAAAQALRGPKPPAALPRLKKILDDADDLDPGYRSVTSALAILGNMGGKEAQFVLARFLGASLEGGNKRRFLHLALAAFEQATGQRWMNAETGNDRFQKAARKALAWWVKQNAS
jgi:HEAT repeat protein